MYRSSVCFRGELGFLNCNDIYMYAVYKQFELLEFGFDSVYVDLQYDEMYLIFSVGYLWSVCDVVFEPYVDAVTVMRVLFVVHVCMLRECEGAGNAGVGDDGGVVVVSGHVGGLGIVPSTADVLRICVVRGMKGGGRVKCVWLGVAWEDMEVRGLGLGFTNPVGTGGVLDVFLCCGGEWVGGLEQGIT